MIGVDTTFTTPIGVWVSVWSAFWGEFSCESAKRSVVLLKDMFKGSVIRESTDDMPTTSQKKNRFHVTMNTYIYIYEYS